MITLQYYGPIREYTKLNEESVEADTLGRVMEHLKTRYGKEALKVMKASMIALNGVRVESLKRGLPLPPGAELGIFPVCCGG